MPEVEQRVRLISDRTRYYEHREAGRDGELCDWVRANNLDPNNVPIDYPLTVEDTPDGRIIRCRLFATTDDGHKTHAPGEPHEHTVPLIVEPPDHWPVYADEETSK